MFSLKTADSAKYMIQMVFITGEIDKFPSQDSAICTHNAADRIRIDSQINAAYHLLFYHLFLISLLPLCKKIEGNIYDVSFPKLGQMPFSRSIFSQIFHIGMK